MKNLRIEIKWAIIYSLMTLGWILLERILGLHGERVEYHASFTNFIALPSIIIFVLALKEKRNKFYDGYMSYGEGFIAGLKITFMVMLLSPVVNYLALEVVSPNYLENIGTYAVSIGLLSQEQAQIVFSLPSYILQGLIGAAMMGFLASAIVAIFTRGSRKKVPSPPSDTE